MIVSEEYQISKKEQAEVLFFGLIPFRVDTKNPLKKAEMNFQSFLCLLAMDFA